MSKYLIFLATLLISGATWSNELSLSCDIKSTYNASNGDVVKSSGKAIIEVTDDTNFRVITISSDVEDANSVTVATRLPSNMRGDISDFTTKSKWDIQNVIERDEGKMTNRVIIDRVTGMLVVNVEAQIKGRISRVNIGGNCKKMDTNNRKF
jgi:hypothetical protein